MNDRLRNAIGRFSTADETSDHEKEILNPERPGQAQHSSLDTGPADTQKTVTAPQAQHSSPSTGTADTQMTVTGNGGKSF